MGNDYYMIVFTDKHGKLNFCSDTDGGYPFYTTDFHFSNVYYSKKQAQKAIDCWTTFNMWKPKIGFTLDNVKIKKLVCYLTDDNSDKKELDDATIR